MSQLSAKKKILVIINPISGTAKKKNLPEIINRLIDKDIFDIQILYSRYKGEATEIVSSKLADNYTYFVAVGGDGTVNEIAKALIGTEGIMGILPIGSGNGLARHLQIPLSLEKAIQVINKQKHQAIDYGLINEVPFFCCCGVGFDAHIGHMFSQAKSRGFSGYIKTTVREYMNYKPEVYRLTVDNNKATEHKAFLITFANGSQYGNNAHIAPLADIKDGKLDICILSPFRLFKAPAIGASLFFKNIDRSSHMHTEKASRVLLERAAEGVIHFDGEPCMMGKRLEISVIHKGLNILVP